MLFIVLVGMTFLSALCRNKITTRSQRGKNMYGSGFPLPFLYPSIWRNTAKLFFFCLQSIQLALSDKLKYHPLNGLLTKWTIWLTFCVLVSLPQRRLHEKQRWLQPF